MYTARVLRYIIWILDKIRRKPETIKENKNVSVRRTHVFTQECLRLVPLFSVSKENGTPGTREYVFNQVQCSIKNVFINLQDFILSSLILCARGRIESFGKYFYSYMNNEYENDDVQKKKKKKKHSPVLSVQQRSTAVESNMPVKTKKKKNAKY